jgi:methenyltetrahydromethanopterin cyclohydrolase
MQQRSFQPSVNRLSAPLVAGLVRDAEALRIGIIRDVSGATLIDAGIEVPGGVEAGRRIAEICLGGLGRVAVTSGTGDFPWVVTVYATNPVLACLGSQYAGWMLKHEEGENVFFALGSGPGRSLVAKEEIYGELGYRDRCADAVLVLEVDRAPPTALLQSMASECGVQPENLTVIMTPTQSLAGSVQIVARSLEVALHKAHTLKFHLDHIVDGLGSAPLPPPHPDFVTAMGRTNDAILYGGTVQLFVTGTDEEAEKLADELPSCASRDYGRPFAEIFAAVSGDFYKIDPFLFSPGLVQVTQIGSGKTFRRGKHDTALINRSFAIA